MTNVILGGLIIIGSSIGFVEFMIWLCNTVTNF